MKTITVYLYTLLLALVGFAPAGFAATDTINVQFSNGGASQTGAAVIGSAGDYWNKTTGSSSTNLSLNKTDNTASGAALSWSASGVGSTGTNNAFIAQNTAWKNLFSGQIYAASGATMTANFSGLTANIPVRVYFYSENDQGGNGRKLQASLNGGAYAATTVGSDNTVYSFIKNQNYLVVDGTANASGQLNINLKGVSGARDGIGILMGIQLIASTDTPSLNTPSFENVGAGMATLRLQASADGTGYFTLLTGSNTACGTAAQVKAGLTSAGATASYHGSLPLTANTQGKYTVRNLTQLTDYTVCFSADSPTLFPAAPVSANLSTTAAHLNGSVWSVVGTAGFSAGDAVYTSLAFAPDGTPYVAYKDNDSSEAAVMKFNGTAWVTVGAAGYVAQNESLAIAPDGTPYLAYGDKGNSGKATVRKFNGTAWDTVGAAGFSAGEEWYTSLAFAPDGTPYLAYRDNGNSGKATVMQFNGTAWVTVGSAGFSAGVVDFTSLAFAPDGTPYLAYTDHGNSGKATVMQFTGTAWVAAGTAGFSAGQADYTSLAIAPDGTPYLAYQDSGYSNKATVMQFDGTAWVAVGSAGFSTGSADFTSLAFAPDGTPYLAYQDAGNATVMKFFNGDWVAVGAAGFPAAWGVYFTSLAFAPDGTPYVAYRDSRNYYRATVMKFSTAATTTALKSSLNPSRFGQSVTLTATVSPAAATGSVTFKDGGSTLGTSTLSGGSATYINSALSVGGHGITAVYAGDSAYSGSTSSVLTQTINKANTTTGLVSSLNPSNVGDNVTFTATVTPSATGTVEFFDSSISLGSGTLNSSSQTTVATSALTVGGHSITGVYSGNAAYNTSTSPVLRQTVNGSGVSITVATNPSGLGLTVDGSDYTAPQTFSWTQGSSHTLAVTSPQAGSAGTRHPFANWSDGGLQSHAITTPATPATYTASFGTEYQLTLNAGTGGSIIPASGNWYAAGSTPSIISTASNSGYVFDGWNLDSGSGPVLNVNSAATQVTMNGPTTVSAAFKAVTTTLSASIGSKSGTIGGVRSWNVSVSNTGGTTANAAQIDGLTLSSSGACKPVATTSFPLALGDISPNDALTGVVSINFTGCKSSIKFSVNIRYSADGGTSSGVTPLTGVSQ